MKQFVALATLASSAYALDDSTATQEKVLLDSEFRFSAMRSQAQAMDKEVAVKNLEKNGPVSGEVHSALAAIQTKKLKKDTAVRAVTTLNDMYLEAEKELDEKIFDCTVQRIEMKKSLEIIDSEIGALGGANDDSNKAKKEAEDLGNKADTNIGRAQSELDQLNKDYLEVKAEDDKELDEKKATLAVMSFILEIAQCKTSGLLLNQKVDATVLSCAQQNAENGSYLVNMFANTELQRRVEAELTAPQREKLAAILGQATGKEDDSDKAIDADLDEQEKEATPESFIQLRSLQPEEEFKSCSAIEPDCAIMTDKVGGMYGDARDAVDRKNHEMNEKKHAYQTEKDDMLEMIQSYVDEKNIAMQEVASQSEEQGTLNRQTATALERQREEKDNYRNMWSGCLKDVNHLMFEGVCSILNVRKNVLDAAEKVTKVKPDDLDDCKMTEWMQEGECSHECVKREAMPNDDTWKALTAKHTQKYTRSPQVAADPKDGLKYTLALPCPAKMVDYAGCNKFLCPVDCEQSEFSAWSECTKKCGGGTRAKTRSVTKRPKHNGKMCDSLSETAPCKTFSCDVDCRLRRSLRRTDWGACVRGCRDVTDRMIGGGSLKTPFRMGSRPVVIRAKGKGKCPKKWSPERARKTSCNAALCRGDEKCVDKLDLIFAFDSSGSLGESNFETFKNFTSELIAKMQPTYFSAPAVKVGLVQFGNGMLVKQEMADGSKKTMVKKAIKLTAGGPISNMAKAAGIVAKAKWQKGFTNMAQGLIAACDMIGMRGRKGVNRKVVVISDGQPTLNFATNEAATACKDKNIALDFIVVSSTFDKDNSAWDLFKRLPSYPWTAHTHHIKGLSELNMGSKAIAKKMLPRVCPKARSVKKLIRRAQRRGLVLVHRGRDCGNWWYPLGRFRNVRQCARKAAKKGFRGFVFQFARQFKSRRGFYWCWSDKKFGKMRQFKKDNPFEAVDKTCTCTNRYCTGKVKGAKPGWKNQRVLKYTGYSHWAVIRNRTRFYRRAKKFGKKVFNSLKKLGKKKLLAQTSAVSYVSQSNEFESMKAEMIESIREADEETDEQTSEEEIQDMLHEAEERMKNA